MGELCRGERGVGTSKGLVQTEVVAEVNHRRRHCTLQLGKEEERKEF